MHHFSDLYLQVRQKENRIYTDEEVRELPYLKAHQHSKEWKIRASNAEFIKKYILKQYPNPVRILETGSGNGWLTHFLSQIPHSTLTGIEINEYELEQAQRLFHRKNLVFELKNLTDTDLSQYDIILFAASIQYFEKPQNLFNLIFSQNPKANILCTDSFWYKNDHQAKQAKIRSQKYYAKLGIEEMANYYYHHTFEILKPYTFRVLNDDFFYKIRLKIQGIPFMPCISVTV